MAVRWFASFVILSFLLGHSRAAVVPLNTPAEARSIPVEGCARNDTEVCACEYHDGGCVISRAPPSGFKCTCKYKMPLSCSAEAFPCVENEHCPGNVADYCACKTGGGDCGGYVNPDTNCYGTSEARSLAPSSAQCKCSYYNGGCTIAQQAPFGWKCVCEEVGFQNCRGWAQGCAHKEVCLGYEHSYCACKQGGGNCEGYFEKPDDCPTHDSPERCNCNEKSAWSKGFYTIEEVQYDIPNAVVISQTNLTLDEKFIPNKSDKPLAIDYSVLKNMTFSSTFEQSGGIQLQRSLIFEAPIPRINITQHTPSVDDTFTHVYGEYMYTELTVVGDFKCKADPFKQVVCVAKVQNGHLEVPYAMTIRHNIIPDCTCQSNGSWKGLQPFNILVETLDSSECNSNDCRQRADPLADFQESRTEAFFQ